MLTRIVVLLTLIFGLCASRAAAGTVSAGEVLVDSLPSDYVNELMSKIYGRTVRMIRSPSEVQAVRYPDTLSLGVSAEDSVLTFVVEIAPRDTEEIRGSALLRVEDRKPLVLPTHIVGNTLQCRFNTTRRTAQRATFELSFGRISHDLDVLYLVLLKGFSSGDRPSN